MADLDHRAGRCAPVTLSNDKAPNRIRACSHPHPIGSSRLGPLPADYGRLPFPFPAGLAVIHYLDPRPAQFVHADLKRE